LWAGTALHLAQAGYPVRAFKTNLNPQQPTLQALLRRLPYRPPNTYGERLLARQLQRWRPELVLLSQGANYDGFRFAAVCRQLGLPYVLLAQKVTTGAAPYPQERALVQASYLAARRSYFVYYGGPKLLIGWGSEEMTTGYCLKALARYRAAVAPGP
jgi:hypothetical protein